MLGPVCPGSIDPVQSPGQAHLPTLWIKKKKEEKKNQRRRIQEAEKIASPPVVAVATGRRCRCHQPTVPPPRPLSNFLELLCDLPSPSTANAVATSPRCLLVLSPTYQLLLPSPPAVAIATHLLCCCHQPSVPPPPSIIRCMSLSQRGARKPSLPPVGHTT